MLNTTIVEKTNIGKYYWQKMKYHWWTHILCLKIWALRVYFGFESS